ncbi:acyl-CoA synthetase [Nocardioides limicola]|uniref:acyl-CoA synthetase n=1 Tax=Nocardioides limicola TaxID=2803368 RepID=UPI00193B305E|nr:long-chain fatty acid--CoA ligase [Nocardioides sp. DJM-14]
MSTHPTTAGPVAGHPANSGHSVDISVAAAVARHARFRSDVTAVVYDGDDLTYGELEDRAARLATVLADAGLGEGDRVAYVGLNSTSFLLTMLAAFRLGAIHVPVNFRLAGPELQSVLERSGATVLVCEQGHRAVVDELDLPDLRQRLLVDDDPAIPAEPVTGQWRGWRSLLSAATPYSSIAARTFDDPAILMFTSGTTGLPKGVVLTHGNAWWNSINVELMLDSRRGDTTHAAAPIFHIGALNSFVLRSLVRGNRIVLRRAFDPEQTLRDYVDYEVASTFAVPAMLQALARTPGLADADLSHLRSVVVAGAPVPPSLIKEYAALGVTLQQAWGLTETAPFATHLPVEWTEDKLGSAGIPMPYTEVRVVDVASNQPLPAGQSGEIVVRGPNVTPGYWENPEATAAAFDAEGWFHSGDVGYLDDDGCLFIVDRLKDMIISGGENVYPAEVERALADLPGATDVAVVGMPDEQWGEAVVAMITAEPGADLTLEKVRDHAAKSLARYKLPTRLHVADVVPRNASGKLDKVRIRQIVEADQ